MKKTAASEPKRVAKETVFQSSTLSNEANELVHEGKSVPRIAETPIPTTAEIIMTPSMSKEIRDSLVTTSIANKNLSLTVKNFKHDFMSEIFDNESNLGM